MQPCLHTSRDSELTTSQDGSLVFWGALSILMEAEIFSLPRAFPFVSFLITLAFIATHFPSRLAFLLTFSPGIFCHFALPVPPFLCSPGLLPSSPPAHTAKPWSLSSSPFPEPNLCDSHGQTGSPAQSLPAHSSRSCGTMACSPTVHMVPRSV